MHGTHGKHRGSYPNPTAFTHVFVCAPNENRKQNPVSTTATANADYKTKLRSHHDTSSLTTPLSSDQRWERPPQIAALSPPLPASRAPLPLSSPPLSLETGRTHPAAPLPAAAPAAAAAAAAAPGPGRAPRSCSRRLSAPRCRAAPAPLHPPAARRERAAARGRVRRAVPSACPQPLSLCPGQAPFVPPTKSPCPQNLLYSPPPPSLAQPLPSTGHRLCPSRASGSADKGCRALQRPAFSEGGARRGEGYL